MKHWISMGALALLAGSPAWGADARQVSEPQWPQGSAVCGVLEAKATDADPTDAGDTERVQQAINSCAAGQALKLVPKGSAAGFHTGPLTLRAGVTLWIDRGATLYAAADPLLYDVGSHDCGRNGGSGRACRPYLTVEGGQGGGIIGEGVIDGQGGEKMAGRRESWWQLSRRAQKENARQNVPYLIVVERAREFTLYSITIRNAQKFHVVLRQVDGFTAWGVKIDTPADARNTDGIDPMASRNITITHSYIRTGDDDVAIKAGSEGPSENITIAHNHFYSGHGMSIGSETNGGVRGVLVEDLTLDGTTSGLRIKSDLSRGGVVNDVTYRDICMREVRRPIDIDTAYDSHASGSLTPDFSGITMQQVHGFGGGKIVVRGIDAEHPVGLKLDSLVLEGGLSQDIAHARFTVGPGPVQPTLLGSDASTTVAPAAKTDGAVPDCAHRFEPFPVTPAS